MADQTDDADALRHDDEIDDTPTVSCTRCGREWDLTYELEDLQVGNQAFEQFALDHRQHTGHYPDDVTPWIVTCRRCPSAEEFLTERPAQRWAEAHARHTRHSVELRHVASEQATVVEPSE